MTLELNRFAIYGLHSKIDIDVPISDNRLILVGVNGLGKTTVINFIYFVLTEQWIRLLDYEFYAIELVLNGETYRINKEDVQQKARTADQHQRLLSRYALRSPFPPAVVKRLVSHPLYPMFLDQPSNVRRESIARQIAEDLEVPTSYLLRMRDDIPKSLQSDLFTAPAEPPSILNLLSGMQSLGQHQVIYLPTYRRIEQDLKAVFPDADEDELRKLTARAQPQDVKRRGHIELVQFGMHDVEKKISEELESIQRKTRAQLSNLIGNYLKDIIGSRADKIDVGLIKVMSEDVVQTVLSRVEEHTLSAADKREVQLAIMRLRAAGNAHQDARDRYLTYFFSRLLEIYVDLSKSEQNIRRLVDSCNRYFERKQLIYNDADYSCGIFEADSSPLSWKALSSGEKQVASLFTHLHLAPNSSQIVLIDEPELSLSVPWQKTLLPDIWNSDSCKLLIAVTHSPFIYSNELDGYAVDMARCIRPHGD